MSTHVEIYPRTWLIIGSSNTLLLLRRNILVSGVLLYTTTSVNDFDRKYESI